MLFDLTKDKELVAAVARERQLQERILDLEKEVEQLNGELEELEGDSDE
jgi:predicted  nucleic acid-binding Zn-ribbon protein